MTRNDPSGKEDIIQDLKEEFSESQMIELMMCISFFIGVGRMNRFLDIEF